jgi:hypothetical protein
MRYFARIELTLIRSSAPAEDRDRSLATTSCNIRTAIEELKTLILNVATLSHVNGRHGRP